MPQLKGGIESINRFVVEALKNILKEFYHSIIKTTLVKKT